MKRKQVILVSIIIVVFIVGTLLVSDSMIPTYKGEGIINQDTNAFTIVEIDDSNRMVSIYGKHSFFVLPKLAQGQYSNESFLFADETGYPLITSNVTLKCDLKAALLSTSTIILSFLLSDAEKDELFIVQVYERVAMGNTTIINEELMLTDSFGYGLQIGEQYLISVRMTIMLSGESSVEGLLPDLPCTLVVNSISVD